MYLKGLQNINGYRKSFLFNFIDFEKNSSSIVLQSNEIKKKISKSRKFYFIGLNILIVI